MLLSLTAGSAPAQSPDYGGPEKQMEELFESFKNKNAPDVMRELLSRNPFAKEEAITQGTDTVRKLTEQLRLYLDYEHIATEEVTSRYVLTTYVAHFERQPVLVHGRFYNMAENTWVIASWDYSVDTIKLAGTVRDARARARERVNSKK